MHIEMTLVDRAGDAAMRMTVDQLIIAGWAGRDPAAMEHHIRELEALGVARPKATPTFYRVAASSLTTAPTIQVAGDASSGEAETVLFSRDGALFVGLGSDHTDREVETYGVTISKQVCDKPVSATVWPYEEVRDHWDSLILRSWIVENGARTLYQEGGVSGLLKPDDLISRYAGSGVLPDRCALFGGTLPAIGGIRPSGHFEAELEDPVLSRRLKLAYDIYPLPIEG